MRSLMLLPCLAACSSFHSGTFEQTDAAPMSDSVSADAHIVVPRAVVAAGDFGSPGVGSFSKLDIAALQMSQNVTPGAALGDPVVRQYGNRVYVVNRYGSNNVTILDAKTLTLVDQISTGTDSNPQDVAVAGGKLYIPALGTTGVVVVTPGSTTTTTIDLGTPLGDPDGLPDCVSAYTIGHYVYVACDMQTNFANVLDSKIAVIDSTTNTYVTSVVTPQKNPLGFFARAPQQAMYSGDLLVALAPDPFGDLTQGCTARISTATPTAPTVSCAFQNADLGGYANRLAVDETNNKLYIAVAVSFDTGNLRTLDMTNGTLATGMLSTSSETIVDVAVCPGGDVVATAQKTNATGLRVWRGTQERTTAALSMGIRPTVNALACYDAGP